MAHIDLTTIAQTPPFSFLPEHTIEELRDHFVQEQGKKNEIKFVRGKTKVASLWVVADGSAELYYEKNGEKTLRRMLSEGDCFGGISILLNKSLAVRTMRVSEDTTFYTLPAKIFLGLCHEFEDFKEFFTNTFGKKMLDRSYAEMISRQVEPAEKTSPFFQQRIYSIHNPLLLSCPASMPIRDAAGRMTEDNSGYLLIQDDQGQYQGIITDEDLRKRVVATGFDREASVSDIMSSPLITLPEDAQLFEAYLLMVQKDISHLPVANDEGEISGILTYRRIITEQSRSSYFLIQEISHASSPDQLINIHSRLPGLLFEPIKSGAQPEALTSLITTVADAVLEKVVGFAVEKAGPPPCDFAFIIMGSEGRNEQTLKTDQDNAIIYEDLEDDQQREEAGRYFLDLAADICGWLDRAGFDFCKGNNMAQNPEWCQPLAQWKKYFSGWIHAAGPEDLLKSSIFFDFRWGAGSPALAAELNDFLFDSLGSWSGFFRYMVENALYFKPPLGFFRNIVVESKGEHKDSFDIKRAVMPIIDFARIYALKLGIRETNTLERLEAIHKQRQLTSDEYEDIVQSYRYLMNLRFIRQITAITEEDGKADNFINPKHLTRIDQTMLKEIFKRIEGIQQKMSIEITGIV
jgi:CBS domain-containing protein